MADNKTDPLAEAEVYIAYGRLEQAAQVLREAIKREPNRKDLWDKLAAIIRSKPSVGTSSTAFFKDSSGYRMDADGTEVFKAGRVRKIICFIVFIIFFGFWIGNIHGKAVEWMPMLIIGIIYILYTIHLLSYSVKLTEDRMIVSSIPWNRTFIYTEIGRVYFYSLSKGYHVVDVYNKQGKRIFRELFVDYPIVFTTSLQRRTCGAIYDTPLRKLSKNEGRRIVIYIVLAVIAILCAVIARIFFGII